MYASHCMAPACARLRPQVDVTRWKLAQHALPASFKAKISPTPHIDAWWARLKLRRAYVAGCYHGAALHASVPTEGLAVPRPEWFRAYLAPARL